MLELFSHMLEINSCTSCKGNLSTKVPNDPGKHLCHSFSSSVHPSSQLHSKVFISNEPGFPEASADQTWSTQIHTISQAGESLASPGTWALVWLQYPVTAGPGGEQFCSGSSGMGLSERSAP